MPAYCLPNATATLLGRFLFSKTYEKVAGVSCGSRARLL